MYNISNTATKSAVEAALAAQTRVFKHRISFGSLSAAGVFTAQKTIDEGIISLHISQQMNGNGSGLVMGCCCAACADAEFYNPDKTFVYEGKTLFVECGIQLEDGSFYYIPLGYYKTEKPESDDDYYTVKIKCYDAVNAMTGKWQSALSFPSATAYDILFEAASKYGVGIVIRAGIMGAKLRDRYVTAEEAAILGQYTDREVIGILAGLVGCNARINTVGKLAIGWYSGSVSIPAELQWQNGFKKTQEAAFTISSVTSGSDDNVFTVGTGSGISFINPIITEDEITAICGEISGYEFQPCECEWRGNPCVEVGDRAVVTDRKGKTYSVYIAAQELDLTGGLSSTVSCPAGDAEVSFDTVDERTRSALNKQRTTLQEAIIAASNAINGALGGYLKIGDSDGDGNPDYMLITENANGEAVSGSATNGYIMFNKAGIGLSVDGGKTYRTAITFNGINADCITTGKLSADLIDTSELVISSGNVEGLSDKLSTLTSNVNSANATANSAKTTANNANTTASAAQTTANGVNTVIGQWCYNNDTTYINGGKIATGTIEAEAIKANSITADKLAAGAITAEKVNVGWQSGNLAADWYNPNDLTFSDYFTITTDSDNNYYSTITIKKAYGGTLRCTSKSFYLAAGDMLKFGGTIYNKTATLSGFYIEYASASDGKYAVKVASNSGTSGATQKNATYTATASGWYRLTCAFDNAAAGTYHSGVYCFHSVKGNLIVNGRIESVDGSTCFDLDDNRIDTMSSYFATKLSAGQLTTYTRVNTSSSWIECAGLAAVYEAPQKYGVLRWGSGLAMRFGEGTINNLDPYCQMDKANGIWLLKEVNAVKEITSASTITVTDFTNWVKIQPSGTISSQSELFTGLAHTRTDVGRTVKCGVGKNVDMWLANGYKYSTGALELSESGTVIARLDISETWGSSCGVITMQSANGRSSPLELGSGSTMWFNGNAITASSSEKYKTDIQLYTDKALSLIESSTIYSYKYKDDGDTALTKYGLIIERECPKEIIDNSGDAISLYSMCSILWKSVQELAEKISLLEAKNNA